MRERPIIFSGPMVTAILRGEKTQTRRVVKPQPDWPTEVERTAAGPGGQFIWPIGSAGQQCGLPLMRFPFGRPGDRLWVKEAWRTQVDFHDEQTPDQMCGAENLLYDADADWSSNKTVGRARSALHMPKWASRLTLEVVSVRVERLQGITVNDVVAEGIDLEDEHADDFLNAEHAQAGGLSIPCDHPEIYPFVRLWDSINGRKPGSAWKDDPWVWAIEFKQVTP